MKVLVTGATGLIGRHLIYKLLLADHDVRVLARHPKRVTELPAEKIFTWSDHEVPPAAAFSQVDVVIHLAGENIADQRWTSQRKQRLWDSRSIGTKNLVLAIESLPTSERPKIFISGSAVGIYGQSSESQDEYSSQGNGFLSELCTEWEKQARRAEDLGLRTIIMRTGLVLSNQGGLLSKAGPAVLGDGTQWMSWIHLEDLVRFVFYACENERISGNYNLTAPYPVNNKDFTITWARVLKFPFTFKIPRFFIKLAFGEMSEAILANQKILPARTLASGFRFLYTNLEPALSEIYENQDFLDHQFIARQFVPKTTSEIFPFFAAAENLETLTPPWLNFRITQKSTPEIEQGTLIDYKLKIHQVPVRWRTRITRWSPGHYFVDEQLKGPYQKWHHLHTFESVPDGTLLCDKVTFRLPGFVFGKLAVPFVKKDVSQIFNYRQQRIKSLFAKKTPA